MKSWFDWFRTHIHWFVFIIMETASLVMLFRFNLYHQSVWVTQSNAVVGQVLAWESDFYDYFNLKSVNQELVRENLALQHSNNLLRDKLKELTHDTTYAERLMAEHLEGLSVIPAQVVSNSVHLRNNIITLNKGRLDGVRDEMGVVCGTGIVGIVYGASDHFSLVLPILNSHSSISCRLRGTDFFGQLVWKGGSVLDAYLQDIPRHAKFRIGDVIETSGYSSVFPAGIFVGKVSQVLNSKDGLSYELKVRLSCDLATLRDVNIIDNPYKEELDTLFQQGRKEVRE